MKALYVCALLAGLWVLMQATPASAQEIPNIRGLQAFTAETQFLSLPGYVRWQYFQENNVWLSRTEAIALTRSLNEGGTQPGG